MGAKTNTNYDLLDAILAEGETVIVNGQKVTRRSGGQVYDEATGQWITSKEDVDRIRQQCDDIERFLRS